MSTIQPAPGPAPDPSQAVATGAGPTPGTAAQPAAAPAARTRRRRRIGPIPVTPVSVVVALVLLGSLIFIVYVTLKVHDGQIPLLAAGFVAFGAAWVAIAIGALVAMWRAASYARSGRATALAIAGGIAGLSAIGSFAIAAVLALVLNT
ncbi:MAG TPA: hypothetical protein VE011_09460 [Candidatus Dormibacteraeota bacterium]|nr:hypothetical protein [Candidatus Dormibacteraeota bacterium]